MTSPEDGYTPAELSPQLGAAVQEWQTLYSETETWDEVDDCLIRFLQDNQPLAASFLIHLAGSEYDEERITAVMGIKEIMETSPAVGEVIWRNTLEDPYAQVRFAAMELTWFIKPYLSEHYFGPRSVQTPGCQGNYGHNASSLE
jgi:hypothetical protein